jgi:hypothetical protein
MACAEITDAFTWAKKSTGAQTYPVTAFFTLHIGLSSNVLNFPDGRDACSYGVGTVGLNPAGHLRGFLQAYTNGGGASNPSDAMQLKANVGFMVEIYPDGATITYQELLNGKPIGGGAPTPVTTTCIGGVLLSGTTGNAAVSVGVRRDPPQSNPP